MKLKEFETPLDPLMIPDRLFNARQNSLFVNLSVLSSPLAIGNKIKMATDGDIGQLTPRQIVRLARTISADNMAAIAEGYMDIDEVTIKHTERDTTNAEAFNREIIKLWAYKNPKNQMKVSQNYCTFILFPDNKHSGHY